MTLPSFHFQESYYSSHFGIFRHFDYLDDPPPTTPHPPPCPQNPPGGPDGQTCLINTRLPSHPELLNIGHVMFLTSLAVARHLLSFLLFWWFANKFALFSSVLLIPITSLLTASLTMPACPSILLLLWGVTAASSFCPPHPQGRQGMPIRHTITALNVVEKVEVCGFKDCKRAGGGPRLVKTIGEILKEKDMMSEIAVELCDCQVLYTDF